MDAAFASPLLVPASTIVLALAIFAAVLYIRRSAYLATPAVATRSRSRTPRQLDITSPAPASEVKRGPGRSKSRGNSKSKSPAKSSASVTPRKRTATTPRGRTAKAAMSAEPPRRGRSRTPRKQAAPPADE